MEYKFLSLIFLVISPLVIMMLLLSPFCPNNPVIIRRFSKGFASLHFLYSLCFLIFFNPNLLSSSFSQELVIFKSGWLKILGGSATFGVDGLSLLLCVLTSFVFFISLIVSKYSITSKHKLYYALIMCLEASILGIFCSKDVFLFLTFWFLELIPMYFLILLWGRENSKNAATKYMIYNSLSSILLIFGLLILYYYNFTVSGVLTGNIDALSFDEFINPIWFQITIFICLAVSFAIKSSLFPFHRWYIFSQQSSPMPINMIMASSTLCMGAYGFIRFNMQIFPTAFKTMAVILMYVAIFNMIFGAFTGFIKKNIKDIISYCYISISSFVLLGFTTANSTGITGSCFHIFACTLIFAALYAIVGFIHLRTKNYDIDELGGIGRVMPKLMYTSIPICLAAVGVPFFIGFPSELMIIIGAFTTELLDVVIFQLSAIVVIFILLAIAFSILNFMHKIFFGNILLKFKKIKDLTVGELLAILFLIVPIVLFGMAPMIMINFYNNVVSVLTDILKM